QPSAEEAAAEGKDADSDSRNDGGLLREDVRRAAGSEREWQRKFLDVVCLHRSLLGAGSPAETPSFASPYAAAIRHWTLCSSDALAGVYCVVSLFIFASAATLARLEKGEAMSRDLARCAYHSTGQSQANPPQPSISNSKSWPSMASTPPMASNACIVARVSPCPTTSRPSTSNSTCVSEPMTTTSLSVPRMVVSPVGGVGVKMPRLRAAHDLEVGLAVDHAGDVGRRGPCRLVPVSVDLAREPLILQRQGHVLRHVPQLDQREAVFVLHVHPVAGETRARVVRCAVEVAVADVCGDEVLGTFHTRPRHKRGAAR